MNPVPTDLAILGAILSAVGLGALIYALLILAQLGQKLGAVTKMTPYYRAYYIAVGFVALALMTRLVRASVFSSPAGASGLLGNPYFYLVFYHLPLAVGLCIGLAVTWYYWKWLLKER